MAGYTRKETREHVGASIGAYMAGDDKPLAAFSDYTDTDFGGQSPVGVIGATGTAQGLKMAKGETAVYLFDVSFLTLRKDPNDATYTDEDAENALDTVSDTFRAWVEDNRKNTPFWNYVGIEGRSTVIPVQNEGGDAYWMEVFPIRVEVQ